MKILTFQTSFYGFIGAFAFENTKHDDANETSVATFNEFLNERNSPQIHTNDANRKLAGAEECFLGCQDDDLCQCFHGDQDRCHMPSIQSACEAGNIMDCIPPEFQWCATVCLLSWDHSTTDEIICGACYFFYCCDGSHTFDDCRKEFPQINQYIKFGNKQPEGLPTFDLDDIEGPIPEEGGQYEIGNLQSRMSNCEREYWFHDELEECHGTCEAMHESFENDDFDEFSQKDEEEFSNNDVKTCIRRCKRRQTAPHRVRKCTKDCESRDGKIQRRKRESTKKRRRRRKKNRRSRFNTRESST